MAAGKRESWNSPSTPRVPASDAYSRASSEPVTRPIAPSVASVPSVVRRSERAAKDSAELRCALAATPCIEVTARTSVSSACETRVKEAPHIT
jgi:hypothetical protein